MGYDTILQFVGAFVLLIIIHEFGHFLAAKALGVEVEEFGIGWPPRALKLFTWKGTLYSLNWLPFGGFVRLKGENDPDVEGGLAAASPWVRIGVLLAGPVANLITAILLYTFIFARAGLPDDSVTQVVDVAPGSPAAEVGLLPDDIIRSIAGVEVDSTQALVDAIAANLEQPTEIVIERSDNLETVTLVPRKDPPPGEGAIGITFSHPRLPISSWKAIGYGYETVTFQIHELLLIPSRLINGSVAPEDARLVGYVSLARMFQSVREQDADSGMPAGTQFENAVNLISFGLLMLLLIYVNINDVINPVDLVP
jgi:regulator of sigma E protease